MLSLTRVNSGQASTYYTADDYYLQDANGYWRGELGVNLGYTGPIKEQDFQALILGKDNANPSRFEIQAGGKEHKHSAGVDMTFSAPKSVSIASLVLDDARILEAHTAAVNKTLDYIEQQYTNVRVREGDTLRTEHTGNMLAGIFQHVSSRELDPQLHTHCLVMNITMNKDGQYRAMDYAEIYDTKMFLGQMYRSELAANLKELGYQIESDSKGLFELKGVPQKIIDEFSTRAEQINQRFEELKAEFPNANYAELKAQATIETRKVKDEPSIDELKQSWDKRMDDYIVTKEEIIHDMNNQPESQIPKLDKEQIIEYAVRIATEHEAVAKESDVLRVAAKLGMGEFRVDELKTTLLESKEVIHLNDKEYTTFAIAEMERKIVEQVIDGHGQASSMEKIDVRGGVLDYEIANGFKLTDGQREAVMHVLSSGDRIIAIQGDAGTGKTTMLDTVRSIAEKENIEVIGLSFTGKAASEIEEASQIPSRTIASFMGGQEDLKNKLVVIDEASMLSIKDLSGLLNRCDENTKVVLIGDTKQLQTIGQGKIFSSLQEKEVIDVVRMSEVQRQKDPEYKDVVDKLGAKQITAAFDKLNELGRITQIPDRDTRLNEITKAYLENAKDTIIVTATNLDREELNRMIRDELRQAGALKSVDKDYVTREVKSLRGEDKYYSENYSKGEIIVANSEAVLGKAGAEATITNVDHVKNAITVNDGISSHVLDLKEHGGDLQLYKQTSREFANGDKILFLKNDKGLEVKNGQTGYISGMNKNGTLQVKMDNGKELQFNPNTQYKYITHGYALTDYKSQGQTERHVIYHANAEKKNDVNFNQAYVGITRGKESVTIFTNDTEKLLKAVQAEQVKTSTLDHNLATAKASVQSRLEEIASRIPSIHKPRQGNVADQVNPTKNETLNANKQSEHNKSKDSERQAIAPSPNKDRGMER